MAFIDDMIAQVEAISPKVEITKAGLVTYYQNQESNKGKGGWKQQLVNGLAEITGMKPKNLERRFDPSRLNNVPRSAKEKAQYQALADKLGLHAGRIPPKNGYLASFDGEIQISGKCYPRHFGDLHLQGDKALALANDPADYMIMFEAYFEDEDLAQGFCGDPTVTIIAAKAPGKGKAKAKTSGKPAWFKG